MYNICNIKIFILLSKKMDENLLENYNAGTPVSPLDVQTDWKRKPLIELLWEEYPGHFEKIDLLSWIDENKLTELQKADLVLVYRDNNAYRDMSSSLEKLVENKYGKKVYCVSIPQGTENISDNEMELLKRILNTCHCMTDKTISDWIWIKCPKFEDNERRCQNSQRFLRITEKLEKKFEKIWINTVYVCVSCMNQEGHVYYPCYDHWSMCQRDDWTIFYDPIMEITSNMNKEDIQIMLENMKRFRENVFPNLNVKFIENFHAPVYKGIAMDFSIYKSNWIIWLNNGNDKRYAWTLDDIKKRLFHDFDIDHYTNDTGFEGLKKWEILIVDRHAYFYFKPFWGPKILYAWNSYEPKWWIERFLDEEDLNYVWGTGEAIAETVMQDAFGK